MQSLTGKKKRMATPGRPSLPEILKPSTGRKVGQNACPPNQTANRCLCKLIAFCELLTKSALPNCTPPPMETLPAVSPCTQQIDRRRARHCHEHGHSHHVTLTGGGQGTAMSMAILIT
mmetsp:Transcript_6963/g.16676  ORF Transcript_6963/g.16676 Transcript_6963/m.16676 type:complete len:118 (+) Transcript_6963:316-669(+)